MYPPALTAPGLLPQVGDKLLGHQAHRGRVHARDLAAVFQTDAKKLWHPHNYEVLSGQLTAPGLPQAAEHELD